MSTLEDKINICQLKISQLVSEISKLDPKIKVLVIIESPDISMIRSTNPADISEAIGLCEVTKIRLAKHEEIIFMKRTIVQEKCDEMKTMPITAEERKKAN